MTPRAKVNWRTGTAPSPGPVDERGTVEEMYYDVRRGQVRQWFYGWHQSDAGENEMKWQELADFCESHAIGNDEYRRIVVPVEELLCAEMKEEGKAELRRMVQKPGKKRPRFSTRRLAAIMGYPRLPFYPRNISMLVALAFLCEREGRGQ